MPDIKKSKSKIKSLWFFCAAFTFKPGDKNFTIESMISFTTSFTGVIETAFTQDRSTIENIWLKEAKDFPPWAGTYGNLNDDDDNPSF